MCLECRVSLEGLQRWPWESSGGVPGVPLGPLGDPSGPWGIPGWSPGRLWGSAALGCVQGGPRRFLGASGCPGASPGGPHAKYSILARTCSNTVISGPQDPRHPGTPGSAQAGLVRFAARRFAFRFAEAFGSLHFTSGRSRFPLLRVSLHFEFRFESSRFENPTRRRVGGCV